MVICALVLLSTVSSWSPHSICLSSSRFVWVQYLYVPWLYEKIPCHTLLSSSKNSYFKNAEMMQTLNNVKSLSIEEKKKDILMLKMLPIILLKMNLEKKNSIFIKIFGSFEQAKVPIKNHLILLVITCFKINSFHKPKSQFWHFYEIQSN